MSEMFIGELEQEVRQETQLAGIIRGLDLSTLPQSKHSEHNLPAVSAVYFLFSKGRLLYVGESSNINQRLSSRSHQIWYYCHKLRDLDIAYIEASDREDRLVLEHLAIIKFQPKWNKLIRHKADGFRTQRLRSLLIAGSVCETCRSVVGKEEKS